MRSFCVQSSDGCSHTELRTAAARSVPRKRSITYQARQKKKEKKSEHTPWLEKKSNLQVNKLRHHAAPLKQERFKQQLSF